MQTPHVEVLSNAHGGFDAFASAIIRSISASQPEIDRDARAIPRALNRQVDFIGILAALVPDMGIELRIAAFPVPHRPQAGRVEFVLRLRATCASVEEATGRVTGALMDIWPNLITLIDDCVWQPIADEETYRRIFDLPASAKVTDICRREARLGLGDVGRPAISQAGFLSPASPMPRVDDLSEIHLFFPFLRTLSGWEVFCNVLLLATRPTAVSVRLLPTRADEQEIRFLDTQIEQCERFIQLPSNGPIPHPMEFRPTLVAQARRALELLLRQRDALRDDCFCSQISLVCEDAPSPALIHALGCAITEPVGSLDRESESDFLSFSDRYFMGGFDFVSPTDEDHRRIALHNIASVKCDTWGCSPEGERMQRLRFLMDSTQANAAFRFPVPVPGEYPGLETRFSRSLPAPNEVSTTGLIVGTNVFRSIVADIAMETDDRRRHTYVVGQTGTGKSTLLMNMILQDIEAGRGLCLLDPHGELAEQLLSCIPAAHASRVVYFNPESADTSIGLNLLECRDSVDRELAINSLYDIFDQLYDMDKAGGPIFEMVFRAAAKLVLSVPAREPILSDITRIMTDSFFRDALLDEVKDLNQSKFWHEVFDKLKGDWNPANMAAYVSSKFTRLLDNDVVSRIVSVRKSDLNFRQLVDGGGILIASLSRGRLGTSNSAFVGMILLNLISRAIFSRQDTPSEQRRDFYLYIDEFQHMATPGMADLLSEARKYRCSLVLANQYLHQVPENIREAVLGNVGSIIAFRVGQTDAGLLEEYFLPFLGKQDLLNLPNFDAYVKTLVRGEAVKPFDIHTLPMSTKPDADIETRIAAQTREQYGLIPRKDQPLSRSMPTLPSAIARNLLAGGIRNMFDLTKWSKEDIARVHQIDEAGIALLEEELVGEALYFAGEISTRESVLQRRLLRNEGAAKESPPGEEAAGESPP